MLSISIILIHQQFLQEYLLKSGYNAELINDISKLSGSEITRYNKLISEIDDELYIAVHPGQHLQLQVNGQIVTKAKIQHGDYVSIIDESKRIEFKLVISSIRKQSLELKKYLISENCEIHIGRAQENDIVLGNVLAASRKHAKLTVSNGEAKITNLSTSSGVYVNGESVREKALKYGDVINILGFKFVYLDQFIALNTFATICKLKPYTNKIPVMSIEPIVEEKTFSRAPRVVKRLATGTHEVDLPPSPSMNKQIPLIYSIGPSLTMSLAMIISIIISLNNNANNKSSVNSIIMAVTMLTGAILWPVLMRKFQRKNEIADEKHRNERYKTYIQEQYDELDLIRRRNVLLLTEKMYPTPNEIVEFAFQEDKKIRLWEKMFGNEDFLDVRLGLGDREFDVQVTTRKKGFELHLDALANEAEKLKDEFRYLKNVPITVSLMKNQLVGVFGSNEKTRQTFNNIALNIVGQHSYDEVKLVVIHSKKDSKHFEWLRELPHCWNGEHTLRYVATTKEEVHHLFLHLNEVMVEREETIRTNFDDQKPMLPKYIFFIADESLVENESLVRHMYNANNQIGISSIVLGETISDLPKDCSVLIHCADPTNEIYLNHSDSDNNHFDFSADEISLSKLNDYSRKVAQLKIKLDDVQVAIPERVPFLGMYKEGKIEDLNVRQLWKKNLSYKSLHVPIGYGAGGEMFGLDIHENYHGPHGLVAGMTGAGKSEFLQSYIISAALNYHPHDLAFVLIDYKGGGMANIFDKMPHLAGKITNLSGSQLQRSLNSIDAELKRRQRLLAEYDVKNVDRYQQLYKEGVAKIPLPHLVIIADEFAQLKSKEPEFMAKLIDVAQIGRSLGVHLILATQKPAGLVDDQIWGNTRFRVCLKVLDKQDSNEMIRKPDAAMIKLPGRCYVQVGYDEIYEQVQSAYSGLNYEPLPMYVDENEHEVSLVDSTATPIRKALFDVKKELGIEQEIISSSKEDNSQLRHLIDYLATIQQQDQIQPFLLWVEPLKETIEIDSLAGFELFKGKWEDKKDFKTVVGLGDFTELQEQLSIEIDFIKDGHLSIQGASGTGKSTFVQTLLYGLTSKYSPRDFEFYMFDLAGRTTNYLLDFPHCKVVQFEDEESILHEQFERIEDVIEARKIKFAKKNIGTFEAYRHAGYDDVPAALIVIDGFGTLSEMYDLKLYIAEIVAKARAYGVYFVITGNNSDSIYYKITDNISKAISLRLNDPLDYRDVFKKPVQLRPDEDVRGRGLVEVEKQIIEFQVAIHKAEYGEAERVGEVQQLAKDMTEIANELGLLTKKTMTVKKATNEKIINQAEAQPKKPTTMRKNRPANTLAELEATSTEELVYIGDLARIQQKQYVELKSLQRFLITGEDTATQREFFEFILNSVKQTSAKVWLIDNAEKSIITALTEQPEQHYITTETNLHDFVSAFKEEVEEREVLLKYNTQERLEPLVIAIHSFQQLYDAISNADIELFEQHIMRALQVDVYFIFAESSKDLSDYSPTSMYLYLVKQCNGIVIGGTVQDQAYLTNDKMTATDVEAKLSNGDGYLMIDDTYGIISFPVKEGAN